ncbi:hypothetical protein VCHA53O466_20388 [Vibrio chagasii]|nr:hypothetical protein VCHA53O466_20388 [Vibrio chagasii]
MTNLTRPEVYSIISKVMIISSLFIWLTFYEYILNYKKRSKIIDIINIKCGY